jgi:hypothetical protein
MVRPCVVGIVASAGTQFLVRIPARADSVQGENGFLTTLLGEMLFRHTLGACGGEV